MCGRFALKKLDAELMELLELELPAELHPRYNIAPGQPILAVRSTRELCRRELTFLHWGLIPPWAKDPVIGNRMIMARAETAADKPAFRAALKRRRCLIPADNFYEWQKSGRRKQPFAIALKDGQPFTLGGIWEHWIGPNGEEMESVAILTTEANDIVRPIHDRMPVIIPKTGHSLWLDPDKEKPNEIQGFLAPFPPDEMKAYPVSALVNSPQHDEPACLEPLRDERAPENKPQDLFDELK